jgi:hypothetical protein
MVIIVFSAAVRDVDAKNVNADRMRTADRVFLFKHV